MHLWRAGDEAKVNGYLDDRGLKHHALFARLLPVLIELADEGSEERAILESLSNHVAARGGVAPALQPTLQRSDPDHDRAEWTRWPLHASFPNCALANQFGRPFRSGD